MTKAKGAPKGTEAMVPVVKRSAPPGPIWERDIDRLFDSWADEFRHFFRWPRLWRPERWLPSREAMRTHMPAVDVYDEADAVVVKADLPGMAKDEIDVSLSGSTLTIKGEKKKEEEVKDEDYYRWERSYGAFARSIELPAEVKADEVKATFQEGVLEVRLPKTEAAKKKPTTVKVE
jgi:HSP20 family protein